MICFTIEFLTFVLNASIFTREVLSLLTRFFFISFLIGSLGRRANKRFLVFANCLSLAVEIVVIVCISLLPFMKFLRYSSIRFWGILGRLYKCFSRRGFLVSRSSRLLLALKALAAFARMTCAWRAFDSTFTLRFLPVVFAMATRSLRICFVSDKTRALRFKAVRLLVCAPTSPSIRFLSSFVKFRVFR